MDKFLGKKSLLPLLPILPLLPTTKKGKNSLLPVLPVLPILRQLWASFWGRNLIITFITYITIITKIQKNPNPASYQASYASIIKNF